MNTLAILVTVFLNTQIQFHTLLGKNKNDVQTTMSKDFHDYTSNNFGISTNDNTLRYYNAKKDMTLIYYFNEKQECKHIKTLEDIESLNNRITELDKTFLKNGNLKWKTIQNGKKIDVELIKDEYNFSVIYHY